MKRLFAALVILVAAVTAFAQADLDRTRTVTLLNAVTATGAGTAQNNPRGTKTYQLYGATSSGSGSAVVAVQGTNDGTSYDTIGTITLTLGTSTTSDSFTSQDRYARVRMNVTTLSGTGATITGLAGY